MNVFYKIKKNEITLFFVNFFKKSIFGNVSFSDQIKIGL